MAGGGADGTSAASAGRLVVRRRRTSSDRSFRAAQQPPRGTNIRGRAAGCTCALNRGARRRNPSVRRGDGIAMRIALQLRAAPRSRARALPLELRRGTACGLCVRHLGWCRPRPLKDWACGRLRSCRRSVAQHPCAIQVDIVAMAAFISSFAGAQLAHARPSKQTALRAALTLPGTAETNLAVPSNAVRKVQPYPIAKPPSYSSVDALRPARVSRMDADWATIYEQVRRQVMGNAYVMECEAPDIDVAFSQLKGGNLTVREFVRAVGKSASYRTRFMEAKSSYNFVLLNFKHFLGRAPTQEEVSTHIQILATSGLEAEIDSYIDSDEYKALFGDHVVPYVVYRGTYLSSERFNRMVKANPGGATSDKAKSNLNMIATVAADLPTDAIDVMRGLPSPITSETLAFGTAYYWAKMEKEASEGRSASPIGEKIGKFDHAPISTYTSLCSYDKVNKAPQISVTNVGSDEHSYVSVASKYIAPDMAAAAQMLADCQKYKAAGNAPTGKWMKYYPGTTVNMAPYISLNDTGSDSSRTVSVTLDKVKISPNKIGK